MYSTSGTHKAQVLVHMFLGGGIEKLGQHFKLGAKLFGRRKLSFWKNYEDIFMCMSLRVLTRLLSCVREGKWIQSSHI